MRASVCILCSSVEHIKPGAAAWVVTARQAGGWEDGGQC